MRRSRTSYLAQKSNVNVVASFAHLNHSSKQNATVHSANALTSNAKLGCERNVNSCCMVLSSPIAVVARLFPTGLRWIPLFNRRPSKPGDAMLVESSVKRVARDDNVRVEADIEQVHGKTEELSNQRNVVEVTKGEWFCVR